MSIASELLPEPLGPLQTVILSRGDVDVDPLQVVLPRPADGDRRRAPPPTTCGRLLAAVFFGLAVARDAPAARSRTRRRAAPVWLPATCGDLLGRPLGDDPAAAGAALGAEVDDPVGRLDHVEVVLDHDDRVARRGEAVQHLEQLADVVEVQPGRRLVEDVERLAGAPA